MPLDSAPFSSVPLTYDPLNFRRYETRILTILPDSPDSIVGCTLDTITLLSPSQYSALSYCWGQSSERGCILVNSIETWVTVNLVDALRQFRLLGIKHIWVDAICINQNDQNERSLQIREMHHIYSKAENVFAWLGPEGTDGSMAAISFLKSFLRSSPMLDNTTTTDPPGSVMANIDSLPSQTPHQTEKFIRRWILERRFRKLQDLFERPYWKRLWVIQEIAVAFDVVVVCGQVSISLKDLNDAISTCRIYKLRTEKMWQVTRFYRRIADMRDSYRDRKRLKLSSAIVQFENSQASDERDRIFALLNICDDAHAMVPTPSYEWTLNQVLVEMTRNFIQSRQSLNILLVRSPDGTHPPGLPSWTPNWISGKASFGEYNRYNSYKIDRKLPHCSLKRSSETVLEVEGILVGTINATTSLVGRNDTTNTAGCNLQSTTSNQTKRDYKYYANESEAAMALCSCLIMRCEPNSVQRQPFYFLGRAYKFLNPEMIDLLWYSLDLTEPEESKLWMQPRRWTKFLRKYLSKKHNRHGSRPRHCRLQFSQWTELNSQFQIDGGLLQEFSDRSHGSGWLTWLILLGSINELILGSLVWIVTLLFFICIWFKWLLLLEAVLLLFGWQLARFIARVELIENRLGHIGEDMERTFRKSMRLITSQEGFIGMACAEAQEGDKICFLTGCDCPIVLREAGSPTSPQYQVVGLAFVFLNQADQAKFKGYVGYYNIVQSNRIASGSELEDDEDESVPDYSKEEDEIDGWWDNYHKKSELRRTLELR